MASTNDDKCGCTTVRMLVRRVSRLLNDDVRDPVGGVPENTRWPVPDLIDYLDEGISLLQSLRPDAFTKTVTFKLAAGAHQTLPPEYDTLIAVLNNAVVETDGSISAGDPIVEEDQATARKIRGQGCSGTSADISGPCAPGQSQATTIRAYSMTAHDTNEFQVTPPVPRGADVSVTARVVVQPCRHSANSIDDCVGTPRRFDAALTDWVLHRAYLVETESEFSPRASQAAMNRFYLALDRGLRRESQFGSGFYLGKTSTDGDPNAAAHVQ